MDDEPLLGTTVRESFVREKAEGTRMLCHALGWNVFLFCVFAPIASAAWYACERDAFLVRSEDSKQGSWVTILEKLNAEERNLLTARINETDFVQALKDVPLPVEPLGPLQFGNVYAFVGEFCLSHVGLTI
jgi:hypothetical protein